MHLLRENEHDHPDRPLGEEECLQTGGRFVGQTGEPVFVHTVLASIATRDIGCAESS